MEIASIKNLSFGYVKNKKIISNISLSFNQSEILLISGASGSGKSTLASLFAGHITPDAGEIYLNGKMVTKPLRDIVVVHQENDLFPWLTVREHLDFLKECGLESDKSHDYKKALEDFDLLAASHLYPKEISGGMKRRLAILRGMLMKPKVLILDESMSSMDDKLKLQVMIKIKEFINKNQMVLILIDHNASSIMSFIDRQIDFNQVAHV